MNKLFTATVVAQKVLLAIMLTVKVVGQVTTEWWFRFVAISRPPLPVAWKDRYGDWWSFINDLAAFPRFGIARWYFGFTGVRGPNRAAKSDALPFLPNSERIKIKELYAPARRAFMPTEFLHNCDSGRLKGAGLVWLLGGCIHTGNRIAFKRTYQMAGYHRLILMMKKQTRVSLLPILSPTLKALVLMGYIVGPHHEKRSYCTLPSGKCGVARGDESTSCYFWYGNCK